MEKGYTKVNKLKIEKKEWYQLEIQIPTKTLFSVHTT